MENKTKVIGIRLKEIDLQRLKAEAESEQRSLANYIKKELKCSR